MAIFSSTNIPWGDSFAIIASSCWHTGSGLYNCKIGRYNLVGEMLYFQRITKGSGKY
jgi:hypothetical protein